MNKEAKEKMEEYMTGVLFDAMREAVTQPIVSASDMIHYHRHAYYGYLGYFSKL